MEFEVSYTLENEQQFWDELDDILGGPCQSEELIDSALRNYLSFTANYKDEYLTTEYEVARCSFRLLESSVFGEKKDYVRRQIIFGLLQEDDAAPLHIIAAFLLFDGKQNEATFETLNEEGGFSRILDLIQNLQEDASLSRILLQLLYEMSRIQRIRDQDLMLIEDDFIIYLLQLIEGISDDVSDPYHYPVIRVLLVLNEQYMVSTHSPSHPPHSPLPNKLLLTLSHFGPSFRTFGENIILLLNRETETSLQLLILKLLYLLFTSPPTYEYFYTNDLRVLVDVMIRNLLDLPHSATALRHTYLRVLYPLLAHTQLAQVENHYKREELRKVLALMRGGGMGAAHFGATDETTRRLGARCAMVGWLRDEVESPGTGPGVGGGTGAVDEAGKPLLARPGIGINGMAGESSLSVVEVAKHQAKPGEQTPSLGRKGEVVQAVEAGNEDGDRDGSGEGGLRGGGVELGEGG